ncbi:MAG: Integral rane protein [Myxococcales bacterium]|nr:Integral rane protein [Myxococcales bacterium]
MAASACGFSAMSVLVKLASARLPTGEIVLARALVTLALSYAMVKRADLSPWGTQRGRLVVRGLLGFGGLACYYLALAWLPLADATVLQNTIPLITTILAWWILRERVGWAAAFALACGLGGVLLVVHPGIGSARDPAGVAVALCAAMMSSTAYVTIRQLSRTEHPLVIVFYFPLVAAPLSLPWAAYDFVLPRLLDWLLLAGIGVATQVGQVFLTMGLSLERAARATSVGYLQVAFAMVWQLVIWGQQPSWGTLAGASLIIAGTLAVSATAKPDAPIARTGT